MRANTAFVWGWLLVVVASPEVQAQPVGNCEWGQAKAFLDVGNVRAHIANTGDLFYHGSIYGHTIPYGTYEVPKGGGVQALFAASIRLAGKVDGVLKMAATRYGHAEFWPGPLDSLGAPPDDCTAYDRIWELRRSDLEQLDHGGGVVKDVAQWPWQLGAPIVDGDGVPGNYNLEGGDRPALVGDQMFWWVMNDAGNEHTYTETPPLLVEARTTAFAFAASPVSIGREAVRNATFYRYRFVYKGTARLDSAYLSLFVDPDLGFFLDDYVGSDTTLSLGYAYNAEEMDEDNGARPPAVGALLVQGPSVIEEGKVQRLPMTAFFFEGSTCLLPCDVCEIDYTQYYYDLMQGQLYRGRPITEGYCGTGEGQETSFAFAGDPVVGAFWSEENNDGEGGRSGDGDRRFIMSSGPFTMQPGEAQEVVFAIIWARGNDRFDSVRRLREVAEGIHAMTDKILTPYQPATMFEPGTPFRFEAPYPNPTRGITTFQYSLPDAAQVRLAIYDLLGREVARLVEASQAAGRHAMEFETGGLPAGVYYGHLEVNGTAFTRLLNVQ